MPDERNGNSPLDTIESVAGATLAITAGAALLYRGGMSDVLSSGFRKASRALNDVANTVSNTALRDMDAKFVGDVARGIKSSLQKADDPMALNTNSSQSLLNVILKRHQLGQNKTGFLESMYDKDEVLYPLKLQLQKQYGNNNADLNRKLEAFVDEGVKNLDNSVHFQEGDNYIYSQEFLNKHFGDNSFSEDIQKDMQEQLTQALKKKNQEFGQYLYEKEGIVDNIIEELGNIDSLAKKFGMRGRESSGQKLMNMALGDSQATVNDLLANRDKLTNTEMKGLGIDSPKDIMDILTGMVEENADYGNLYIKSFRVNKEGEISSFAELSKAADSFLEHFSDTLPGKLLKTRDIHIAKNADNVYVTGKGDASPLLTKVAEGRDSTLTSDAYVKVLNKTFKINQDNSLEHISALDDYYLISGEHGTMPRVLRNITGDLDKTAGTQRNKILDALEIGAGTAPSKLKGAGAFFTKFNDPRWGRNVIDSLLYADTNQMERMVDQYRNPVSEKAKNEAAVYIGEYFDKIKEADKFFAKTTRQLDRATINKLHSVSKDQTKKLLNMLRMNDQDMLTEITKHSPDSLTNSNLRSMIKSYLADSKGALDKLSIESNNKLIFGQTRGVKFIEKMRKEIAKEAFLGYKNANGKESLLRLFSAAGVSGQALKETKYLANWAMLEEASGKYKSSRGPRGVSHLIDSIFETQHLFSGRTREGIFNPDEKFIKSFRENISQMAKENASVLQKGFQRDDHVIPGHSFGKYTYMKKTITPLDVIRDLNINTLKSFGKQFVAGRKNVEDITTATMFPYFALHRLVDPLHEVGLGFSAKSTGSVMDLATNIMLKRVLPIAAALTTLSYLDYESENFTGTSLKGAAANSWANISLTNRRIADATGLGKILKNEYELNPMSQYWHERPYQTYEEKLDWYRNGDSPVRKGRWWSFGSASELRGGKIEYFEPNFLRQAHSNWRDIGVYGSEDEKWAHSWIPTPRHPLSPLRALVDPYWLERKHYWDRPYPVSGKLFDEGSPWGVVLNPTVGEILKPQIKMHRAELGDDFVDVRTLIANRNAEVRKKAGRNSSLVRLEGRGFTPVTYTPLGAPTESQRIVNMAVSGGSVGEKYITGSDAGINVMSIADYESTHDALQARAVSAGVGLDTGNGKVSGLSFAERVQISADKGGIVSGVVAKSLPLDMIKTLNTNTKGRSQWIAPKGGDNGVIVQDAIYKEKNNWGSNNVMDPEDAADLMNTTNTKEFLQDAGYSSRELLGMYGFIFEEITPRQHSKRLQDSSRMSSFSRAFWDASIGGAGGEFMEIARRFVPHENHDIDRVNPIKNTMPDWMPARFQYGDPYEKLPKGEMRLPGAGYEDIYTLHPDMYGKYGSFDRMKILADVAPWSSEYKTWKQIAQKTYRGNDVMKAEIKKIKTKVEDQSKVHEFFDYKFQDLELLKTDAVVDHVAETWFSIVGDNKKYKMAGIKMTEGNYLSDVLMPGTPVKLEYGKSDANSKNIRAIVKTKDGNLNRELLKNKKAEVSQDQSVAGFKARFTESQLDRGKIYELIAHAPLPMIHNKIMRVNSPLESWKDEQIYGTPYATWSNPIQGFIIPSFQKAFSVGPIHMALGTAAWAASEYADYSKAGNVVKGLAKTAFLMTNPGGFAGAATGFALNLKPSEFSKWGGRAGAAIGLGGYLAANAQNPIFASIAGAGLGGIISDQFWRGTGKRGMAIGAAAGLAISALKNPTWDKNKMFGPWIPEDTKKKWEIEEYYDRLKYIKYTGLYEKAARLAKSKEHVDIKRIVNKFEYDFKEREKIKTKLLANIELVSNTYEVGDKRRDVLLKTLNTKLGALSYPQRVLKAGEYTKSALAYKQAADSTIYGLGKKASWSQVLRAVPKYERDYTLEFIKETDPKKREEILRYIAPYRRKVLQALWGQKTGKQESNENYFARHKLPNLFWSGWQPGVDLENVEIKTIKNEGMLLSDFGFYDSQSETPEAEAAPEVDYNEGTSPIALKKNLLTALNGAGLIGVEVSIQPSSEPGIQMVANIARITDYQVKQKINDTVGRIFY